MRKMRTDREKELKEIEIFLLLRTEKCLQGINVMTDMYTNY